VFTVGGVTFAFDALHARYVLRARDAVADAVVAFLGRPYPIVDLRQVFGHPPRGTGFSGESDARAAPTSTTCGLRATMPRTPSTPGRRAPERHWVAGLAAATTAPSWWPGGSRLLDALLPVNGTPGARRRAGAMTTFPRAPTRSGHPAGPVLSCRAIPAGAPADQVSGG
jgi:hypothetical protein